MSLKNRFITLSSIGFALGMMIGTIITSVSATFQYADGNLYLCAKEFNEFVGDPLLAFVIQALMSGLIGVVGMGGSSVYRIEEWSILKATVVHFSVDVTAFFLIAFFLRWWGPSDVSFCLFMLVLFIITYVIIWLSQYLSYRSQIKKINKGLEMLRHENAQPL